MVGSSSARILLSLLATSSSAWNFRNYPSNRISARTTLSRRHGLFASTNIKAIPRGKVEDPDDWIRCVSNSLERYYGKSLFDELSLPGPEEIHVSDQHVVLSHGTGDDPIYNYANKAGLLFFAYPEEEFMQLPSRYSAPADLRSDRSKEVQHVVDHGWAIIPEAIRQNKAGDRFLLRRILFFNVHDADGARIGQAATFDLATIEPLSLAADTEERND